jgi:CheY-like chemotaxis protein
MGRAAVVDPVDIRGEKVAGLLRRQGYAVERFATGRDLLRRVGRSADIDLAVIDRHVPDPTLLDVVAMLRPDATGRPVLVVASTDQPRPVPLEHLILRLAMLVAATETSSLEVPPPFAFDPRRTVTDEAAERAQIAARRDRALAELLRLRLDRLTRLVEAADLPSSIELKARLAARLPQATYAALAAEFPVTAESAPETYKQFVGLNATIRATPKLTQSTITVPTGPLGRIVEELELVVNPGRLDPFDPEARKADPRLQKIYALTSAANPDALALPADTSRDVLLEDKLSRMLRPYPGVTVIRPSSRGTRPRSGCRPGWRSSGCGGWPSARSRGTT